MTRRKNNPLDSLLTAPRVREAWGAFFFSPGTKTFPPGSLAGLP